MLFISIFTIFVRIKKHFNRCSFLYSVSPAHRVLGSQQGKAGIWEPRHQVCPHGVRRWMSWPHAQYRNMGKHGYSVLGGRSEAIPARADLGWGWQRTADG